LCPTTAIIDLIYGPFDRRAADDGADWVMRMRPDGIARVQGEILNKTLKELGIKDLDT
jgi:hypothetical protein